MITYKIVLDERRAKTDGKFPIMFRITFNRKTSNYSSGIALKKEHWNAQASLINSTCPNFMWKFQMDSLKTEFKSIFDAFEKIGLDEAKRLEFDHIKIRKAIKEKEFTGQKSHFGFLSYIESNFLEGQAYPSLTITNKLKT